MLALFQRTATHSRRIKWNTSVPAAWNHSSGTLSALGAIRTSGICTLSTLHSQANIAHHSRSCFMKLGITLIPRSTTTSFTHFQEQYRSFASRNDASADASSSESDEEFVDDNGMTMKDRERIEKWAKNFTKESIPKGLLTLNFVRSSGPGGQNVNKVNTKVDMRFIVDDAVWLPEYVRDRLKSQESNKINKSGEYVLTSDRKRTQMANLDDCLEKLHEILLRMGELSKLPDAEALEKLERIRKAGNNRRKVNKQFQSQKKSSRRVSRDD
ncbi:hypothetical protein BGZ46_002087 [Entomortierella lignicola]|nr:hypothetical protein BGZ46_002087 [Entomortierella lignicola]